MTPPDSQGDGLLSHLSGLTSVQTQSHAWDRPPDAGASVLGAHGFQNPIVRWLLARNPELLALSPRELMRGLRAPMCPGMCWSVMLLRIKPAEGRRPSRLIWKCFKHPEPIEVEVDPPKMPRPRMSMKELLDATRRGALLDYQPSQLTGIPEVKVIEPPRKKRVRR